ncbi:MAG: hypothetical protein IT368_01975 [Candidatus Hydrogenedentes bacterium]|nr:hypothetical protein [Candidatus Hydrogenedentota bacterium]
MFEGLDCAIADLKNRQAGWVTRRDAAEAIGEFAARSLAALHAHGEDDDVDVQSSVARELARAKAALRGIVPAAKARTLRELVHSCAKEDVRVVRETETGYEISVRFHDTRHQVVYITPHKRKDGVDLIRVFTYCANNPNQDVLTWALRSNAKLVQCALAVFFEDGVQKLVLMNNFILSETTPTEIKAAVKEIAFYGDWLEEKVTGMDDF